MKFWYRNWKNKVSYRRVIPFWLFYGKNKYHTKLTWLLLALDLDKKQLRTFDIKRIIK